jgi:cyclopropane-fatty-acyl-phospholipid synthase
MNATDNTAKRVPIRQNSRLTGLLRDRVIARMQSIEHGCLVIRDGHETIQLGNARDSLHARVTVHDQSFWRLMATGGSVGAAEAYMAGLWDSPDLVAVIRVLARNREILETVDSGSARLGGWLLGLWHRFNRNSIKGSRRNIAAHYDLGNEFFAAWLDDSMMYSSALYLEEGESLEQAQFNKLERLCRKLDLGPDDHLLEIGSGWGALAVHAASRYGCRVTTTTISRRQYEATRQRVNNAGLEDRVEVLMSDYRDLDGRYDKLVSVEMIEAVGHQYLDTYLARIDQLLKPNGLAMLQAITIEDYRYDSALRSVDFIKRYIFPGSFIPSISAMTAAMARSTRLGLIELADFGTSYATTLADWRKRFEAAWDEISTMGFDEVFRRRWRYYLAYCEGGFKERAISDVHLLLAGPEYRSARPVGLTADHR